MAAAFANQDMQSNVTDLIIRPCKLLILCEICCGSLDVLKCNVCMRRICKTCLETHGHHGAELTTSSNMKDTQCVTQTMVMKMLIPTKVPPTSQGIIMICQDHQNELVVEFCDNCTVTLCNNCDRKRHETHLIKSINDVAESIFEKCDSLCQDLLNKADEAKRALIYTDFMASQCKKQAVDVSSQINYTFSEIEKILEDRKQKLLAKVEHSKMIKLEYLMNQSYRLNCIIQSCNKIEESFQSVIPSYSKNLMFQNYLQSVKYLHSVTDSILVPHLPPNGFIFELPMCGFYEMLSSIGSVNTSSFCLWNLSENIPLPKSLIPKLISSENTLSLSNEERYGNYFALAPDVELMQQNNLEFNRRQVELGRYSQLEKKTYENIPLVIGEEGEENGKFCRPWGVCCDLDDNIIVADRSNNRIQVFKSNGKFLRKFGTQGSGPGQFDRPAGVASDHAYNIIVADKDNHRIQVFNKMGEFQFTFGEKGSKHGQFNYPWDVDVNSSGLIVVSDTRNRRVQLFGRKGRFIAKYGYEANNMLKHFDSPRGVCFTPDGGVAITDFNNHHIIKLKILVNPFASEGTSGIFNSVPFFIGSEGNGKNQFFRPQGIAVNSEGHLVVADSRNNRIHIIDQQGNFRMQLGKTGEAEAGELNVPSGICVLKDDKIVVVDFGNNRVQIFH